MNEELKYLIAKHYRAQADKYEYQLRIEQKQEEIDRLKKIIESKDVEISEIEKQMLKIGLDPKSITFRYRP